MTSCILPGMNFYSGSCLQIDPLRTTEFLLAAVLVQYVYSACATLLQF